MLGAGSCTGWDRVCHPILQAPKGRPKLQRSVGPSGLDGSGSPIPGVATPDCSKAALRGGGRDKPLPYIRRPNEPWKRFTEKINTLLHRGNPTPWPELQTRLNRLLSGWAQYFGFGFTGQADNAIGWHLRERARRFLCRRHKLRVSGTGRFGYAEIHGKMGGVDIRQARLPRRPMHALS